MQVRVLHSSPLLQTPTHPPTTPVSSSNFWLRRATYNDKFPYHDYSRWTVFEQLEFEPLAIESCVSCPIHPLIVLPGMALINGDELLKSNVKCQQIDVLTANRQWVIFQWLFHKGQVEELRDLYEDMKRRTKVFKSDSWVYSE